MNKTQVRTINKNKGIGKIEGNIIAKNIKTLFALPIETS